MEHLDLVSSAFHLMVGALQPRRASLMLRAGDTSDELIIAWAVGLRPDIVRDGRIPGSHPIASRVVAEARPLLVENIDAHPELPSRWRANYLTPSFASVPVRSQGSVIGVLNVADKVDSHAFSESELEELQSFADHIAGCLEREAQVRQTYELARTDPLTGLFNRRALQESLSQEVERSNRSGDAACLLLIDLDHFKIVNDSEGHAAGDTALVLIGQVIRDQLRAYDSVFRYGGDEFVVLLPRTSPEQAKKLAERIQRAIAGTPLFNAGPLERYRPSASIGQCAFPLIGDTPIDIMKRVDEALYESKSLATTRAHARDYVPQRKPHILVLDEDPAELGLIEELFSVDYRVSTAQDQEGFEELLAGREFALFLIDLGPHSQDRNELFEKLSSDSRSGRVPIVVIEPEESSEVPATYPVKPSAIIQKPFSVDQLYEAVTSLVPPASGPQAPAGESSPRDSP